MFNQALFYHLLKHPLYINQDEGKYINILIIGFGDYVQKFLDLSLQIGQVDGKILRVKIISDDKDSVEKYKLERPELENFFMIDGKFNTQGEIYGEIYFYSALNENEFDYSSHYIFIDKGNDEINLETAKKFTRASFVYEGNDLLDNLPDKILPVCVNSDMTDLPGWQEIERMALNVHRVWYKNLNVDFNSILESFNNPENNFYNKRSSITNVLSLKYKLHSLGIDIDNLDFNDFIAAAELFSGLNNPEIFNKLMYLEHRRWVTEKICEGWRYFTDLHDAIKSGAKDGKNKRHVCIRRSEPQEKLNALSREQWDDENFSLSELDELDAMSVKLHRLYSDEAEKIRGTNLLNGPEISGIRSMIDDSPEAVSAFNEWYSCLQDIWNGDIKKVYVYKGRLKALERSFDNLSISRKNEAASQLKKFAAKFQNILLASEYRDYKKDDIVLIEKIPFILTYSDNINIAVPYNIGGNVSSLLGNCAAAVVINPSRIIYLCLLTSKAQEKQFRQSFGLVIKFLERKYIRAEINFLVAYSEGVNIAELKRELRGGKIKRAEFVRIEGENYTEFNNILAQHENIILEKNDTELANFLNYDNFSNYRFDMLAMNFTELNNCSMLGYIPRRISISAADMLIFSQSFSIERASSIFSGDYASLWAKYNDDSKIWKRLCNSLDEVKARKELKFAPVSYSKPEEHKYYISVLCRPIAERIITFLAHNGFAYSGTSINGYNMNLSQAIIKTPAVYADIYNEIFADPYVLAFSELEAVECWLDKNNNANIKINDLVVKDAAIPNSRKARELLNFFASLGYINNLRIDAQNSKASFSYVSHSIRKLMTSAGRMLELYVYHKAEESGLFDDVVIGFNIGWHDGGKNEFDCIIIKGFKALCIECKAQSEIINDYYDKLYKITNQLGVNAHAVLITDLRGEDTQNNAELRQKWSGKITTIYEREEIENIAGTLQRILEGN